MHPLGLHWTSIPTALVSVMKLVVPSTEPWDPYRAGHSLLTEAPLCRHFLSSLFFKFLEKGKTRRCSQAHFVVFAFLPITEDHLSVFL